MPVPDWTMVDSGTRKGVFTGADDIFSKEIEPLVELFDELQQCLDSYRNADSAVEELEQWQRAESAYREIMAVWKLIFLRARGAVNNHLFSMGLSLAIPEHDALRRAVQEKCVPSATMAVTLLQYEEARNKRKTELAKRTDW
ncbi:hypothetical protein CU102_04775 [Phyllobacterium brassicacearum]|uniref:Uncharacterized protein n=1 Tax=Phyllobacterium brassicacearum TaxID=314235 RepID=A0A2P7BVC0_9HYPH|nr:hypothetical protein [Phyllobacterium brassicacearum]PSH70386.1 hypothetical protein CU102_04775 [Phyllobacterium brassicacearum]TDQ28022.1 hypothetical protein DEV91_11175 [Phyllobacterium brassicacearum]